jgi:hypothetical protein
LDLEKFSTCRNISTAIATQHHFNAAPLFVFKHLVLACSSNLEAFKMNSLSTPAARQPGFPCSQCIRHFFSRTGLKNHIRAKHPPINQSAGQSQSPPAPAPPSCRESDEEQLPPPGSPSASSVGMEGTAGGDIIMNDDYDNHDGDYIENNISDHNFGSNASRSSTPISVPSSQNRAHTIHTHQQKPADEKYLRKIFHPKLNGQSSLMVQTSLYLL